LSTFFIAFTLHIQLQSDMKKGFDVSLLLIILSLIVWTWALGPVGTIVGVPLTMVLYRVQAEMAESENAARLPASSEPKT
jgi:predicted PurR-regulated permease PerM